MRKIGWILLNVTTFCLFLYLDWAFSGFNALHLNQKFVLHFEQRNCSKNGTKEYIASENICVCKTGWETGIDQNPATRVYCNIYVGSSTNNSSGTTSSSSTTITEYSVIIIIVIIIIIGVCICCCCRRPLIQCMQDCCCGCTEFTSWSSFGSQRGTCKNCASCHRHEGIPCSSHVSSRFISTNDCMHCQPSVQPVYIQQPPCAWMQPSVTAAPFEHPNGIILSNEYQGIVQNNMRTPAYNSILSSKRKWKPHKQKIIDQTVPIPNQHMSRPKIMPPSYSEVTSVESETQVSNPDFQYSSVDQRRKKGRQSHKHKQQVRKT
ncbi:hypothetical protein GpartN1_g1510.t1 [Galdieria partita]|uniref:Uncharacterized protein n=1 Tax=Galdieria partita TaxID=83374 RepID=A0A9C7PSK5_9RHOD|nr:hypothetical protein GpartN1_g1510.t1 [Galdieria partita]